MKMLLFCCWWWRQFVALWWYAPGCSHVERYGIKYFWGMSWRYFTCGLMHMFEVYTLAYFGTWFEAYPWYIHWRIPWRLWYMVYGISLGTWSMTYLLVHGLWYIFWYMIETYNEWYGIWLRHIFGRFMDVMTQAWGIYFGTCVGDIEHMIERCYWCSWYMVYVNGSRFDDDNVPILVTVIDYMDPVSMWTQFDDVEVEESYWGCIRFDDDDVFVSVTVYQWQWQWQRQW